MPTVNMHEAKTNLSRLVEALVSGAEAEVTIARNGKPAVVMKAVPAEKPKRQLGLLKGKVDLDYEAFQALDAEIWKGYEEGYGLVDGKTGDWGSCSTLTSRSGH